MLLVTYDSDTTDYDSFDFKSDLEAEAPMGFSDLGEFGVESIEASAGGLTLWYGFNPKSRVSE